MDGENFQAKFRPQVKLSLFGLNQSIIGVYTELFYSLASSDAGSVPSSVLSSVPSSSSGILRGATPIKGPSRYLKVNLNCGSREAGQVESQSRAIMETLRQERPRARVQSPGKSQSPARPVGFLHEIREDFSPSPVVRAAAKPGRQISVNEVSRLTTTSLVQPTNCQTVLDEFSPQERLSISFQPTPARFRQEQDQPVDVQVEEQPQQVEDVLFPKPPSELSEVTFKQPTIPISKPSKRKQAPVPTETLESESRYLHSWIPRMKKGKLYVEGEYIDFDASRDTSSEENRRYVTSRIVSRISSNRITTKKRVYVLEGPLVIKDFEQEKQSPTPLFILDKFRSGFPENWEKILNHWAKFDERNKLNISNMSLISSTLLSNYTVLGNTITSLSNVSAINGVNGSHFIQNKTASSAHLSICRRDPISVSPVPALSPEAEEERGEVPVEKMVVEEEEEEESGGQSEDDRMGSETRAKVAEPREAEEEVEKSTEAVQDVEKVIGDEYRCEACQFNAKRQHGLNVHLKSKKHAKVVTMKKGQSDDPSDSRKKNTPPASVPVAVPVAVPAEAPAEAPAPEENAVDVPENVRYSCFLCGFGSESSVLMMEHFEAEGHPPGTGTGGSSGTKKILCRVCDIYFSRKNLLESHLKSKKHKQNEVRWDTEKKEKEKKKPSSGNNPKSSMKIKGKEPSKVKLVKKNKTEGELNGNKSKENNKHVEKEKVKPAKGESEKSKENDETAPKNKVTNNVSNTLNQSIFGRVRKQNKRYNRDSCLYNTPPDPTDQDQEQPDQSVQRPEVSLRRVVLNPFRKKPVPSAEKEAAKKPTKDIGEILKKVSANPKTVKQRLQNAEAFKNFNEDHEDDLFEEQSSARAGSGLLKTTTKSTLLSQDPDSDSEAEISIHSARTPVTGNTFLLGWLNYLQVFYRWGQKL